MEKFIFLISTIIIAYPIFANGAVAVPALDISNQKNCEALGGSWNFCPPNDCQQSLDYTSGKIICPQVCGAPICQGLWLEEPIDLSDIHNESIGHQSLLIYDNLLDNQEQKDLPIKILPPVSVNPTEKDKPNIQEQPSIEFNNIFNLRDFLPAILGFIFGIVLILIGAMMLKKKTKNKK